MESTRKRLIEKYFARRGRPVFTFIGHHTAMKRNLRIVIWQMTNGKTKVFFSTDTEMSGEDVLACSL